MLNDLIIDKLSERIVRRLRQGNEYALKKIGKALKEIKDLPPEEAQKLINVFKYGGDYDKIVNKLAKISKLNKKDIDKIFESVAEKEVNFAKQFYEYRNKKFIPYRQNVELKRLVNTIKRLTLNEYTNITKTTALGYGIKTKEGFAVKAIKEVYHDIIDEGVLNIFQGKQTYDDFLENQIDELGYGLKVIYPTTYIDKDGVLQHYTKRLDSSVKQLLNDGLSEMHREVQEEIGKDFESDGVEITVVVNPAPDHEYVQGHQFSTVRPSRNKLSEFEKFQNDEDCVDVKGNKYPAEFEGHDRRSIGQYNCRHLAYSIIIGVNIQQYSDEELKEIIRKNHDGFTFEGKKYSMYEGSQLQRKIETAVRENKDRYMLAKEIDDEKSMLKAKNKISILQDKYNKLNQASGLPDYEERMQVGAYDRLLRKENYIKTHLLDVNNDVSEQTKNVKTYDFSELKDFIDKNNDNKILFKKFDSKAFKEEYDKFYETLNQEELTKAVKENLKHSLKGVAEKGNNPIGEFLNKELGYDAKPELMNEDDYWIDFDGEPVDKRYRNDSIGFGDLETDHLVRGVVSVDVKNGEQITNIEKTKQYVRDFKEGPYFAGEGIYGNGTYFARSFSYAFNFANESEEGLIYMTPKKDAKIVEFRKIHNAQHRVIEDILYDKNRKARDDNYEELLRAVCYDYSYFSSLLGYDIIDYDEGMVVLNRGSIKVVK